MRFAAISAGEDFTCAVGAEDLVPICWGEGYHYDQREDRPFSSVREESFTSVSSGDNHVCALREDQTVACWGSNSANKASPPPERFSAISSGTEHTCALRARDGVAVCWGSNRDPFDRYDEYKGQASPPYRERFTAISSGDAHTCALREDGTVACWGDDDFGQSSPPEGERFVSILSLGIDSCGLREDGTTVCWGGLSLSPKPL